jgi:hypothetical protein
VTEELDEAAALLAAGRHAAALRHAWRAVQEAVRLRDRASLDAAAAFAVSAATLARGREREDAHVLHRYAEACLADLDAGVPQRPPFSLRRRPETPALKTCPDCAESVRPAARVCRFCGYRFED